MATSEELLTGSGSGSLGRGKACSEVLPPLEIERSPKSVFDHWPSGSESEGASSLESTPGNQSTRDGPVTNRLSELSQSESPLLRELAKGLEKKLNIQTPEYEPPKGSDSLDHPYRENVVAKRWKDIQGGNNWDGLLDPLDKVLKGEIVRYGDFAQGTYDAFDEEKTSQCKGACRYDKENLLEKVGLENRGYKITNFLYAATDFQVPQVVKEGSMSRILVSKFNSRDKMDESQNVKFSSQSNWIGFVAVCTSPKEIARLGRRDIAVSWRGTCTHFEWLNNVKFFPHAPSFGAAEVMVDKGFLKVYTSEDKDSKYDVRSVRSQVHSALAELIEEYKDDPEDLSITLTGHSLGSALATLCAYDLGECRATDDCQKKKVDDLEEHSGNNDKNDFRRVKIPTNVPITVYSFAGPRVGNAAFGERLDVLNVKVLRVVNRWDIVPTVPGSINQLGTKIFAKHIKIEDRLQHAKEYVKEAKDYVKEAVHGKLHRLGKHDLSYPLDMLHKMVPPYKHVGKKLVLDHKHSPYIRGDWHELTPHFFWSMHHLEAYLHVLDGYHRKVNPGPFRVTFRDYALVNKRTNLLLDKYKVPAMWWQEPYKGMQKEDGKWKVPQRDPDSAHRKMDTDEHLTSFVLRMFSSKLQCLPDFKAAKV